MRSLRKRESKIKKWIVIFPALMLAVFCIWAGMVYFEGNSPEVSLNLSSLSFGAENKLSGTVIDEGQGLREIRISLLSGGKETILYQKDFKTVGLLMKSGVNRESFSFDFRPGAMNISDGPAVLSVLVRDSSLRGWFKGNVTNLKKDILIDSVPPKVEILSRSHYLAQGGSGLVIYKITEKGVDSGVMVGDNFFPGYSGYFKNKDIHLAFFALDYTQKKGTNLYIKAVDAAGNVAKAGFPYNINNKKFRNDQLRISDRFLNWKLPGFSVKSPASGTMSMIEKFIAVNNHVRVANGKRILGQGSDTDRMIRWKGRFLRLPSSARKARFADHRTYLYNGKVVDDQYHMGIDLASVKHAPVPVSNHGRVSLVENIGIYGNTVIVDHGFGVFSTYSHMSSVFVKKGQVLKKGDVIGETGITGLTGGDHLHYGMFIHNTFVNPVEWWDGTWIENNITAKIKDAEALYQ